MKGIVYRSAALALACMVALSALALPVSATDYQSTYNFWNWAYDNSWFLGKAIIGFAAGNVCQVSEDGMHHATTHSSGFAGGGRDGDRVYNCVCDLCGQEFQAVATDLEQSYDTIIQNNNYYGVTSNNGIYIHSNWQQYATYTDRDNWQQYTTDFWYYPDADVLYSVYRSGSSTTTVSVK